jgi:hypothetical protein
VIAAKKLRPRIAALACLLASAAAQGTQCTPDAVPGATLLIPYFELDLAACAANTRTTRFWVRNVTETHQLAQVTLWGEYGVPVAGFQIYLPPLAGRHVDLSDVLCRGVLPSTGAGVSPRSPFGADAQPNFPGCNGGADPQDGLPVANRFSAAFLADVQQRLTGNRSPTTQACYGSRHGDMVARGFITIDGVSACTQLQHYDIGYVGSILAFDNAFVGGYETVDAAQNFAQGAAAVAIEAAPPGTYAPGDVTFYGRFASFSTIDRREPLPSTWSMPISIGGVYAQNTQALVWRETPRINLTSSSCNVPPSPFPLQDSGQVVFDEAGNSAPPPVVFPGQVPPTDQPIAFATQKVDADDLDTAVQFDFFTINRTALLNLQYFSPIGNPPRPYGQSHVAALQTSQGRYSDLVPATALDSSCTIGKAVPADTRGPLAVNPNTRDFIFSNGIEP